jgi:Family of unknown function (DUF5683)
VRKILYIFAIICACITLPQGVAFAQIDPSKQFTGTTPPGSNVKDPNAPPEEEEVIMSTKPSFTIKRYFKALAHKDSMKISQMSLGSMILPGTAQIYNRQTWKLPIVYGTIGGFIGGAVACNISYQRTGNESTKSLRSIMIAGAALSYWGSVMDGVISYRGREKPLPARASMYSALLPGLGQAYNGDYWKIPIFYTGFLVSGYCWSFNQTQYKRYKNMYIEATAENSTYKGSLTPENMKWYRDQHRRLRDYSIIATALIYVLNIVDANVFAHFSNFDVSDDISFHVEPGIIEPIATKPVINSYYTQSLGLKMNLKF